ncbi:exo-alpha-sialidase [Celerinatantimonas sp. YJH-8]|uniref:exo-alpha-sialidase n=1 Tax=Celerinatantimonas sp. YJH-8 TaxID=3228714 RepID=UPI0038BEEE00
MIQLQLNEVHCVAQDPKRHLAFTDLCQFESRYWLSYREASSHHHQDGQLVILLSDDGQNWQFHSRIGVDSGELRDPKFVVTDAGELWLQCARVDAQGLQSLIYRWQEPQWLAPEAIGEPNVWLWRTLWQADFGLSFGYRRPQTLQLYRASRNPLDYQLWNAQPLGDWAARYGYPNETGLAIDQRGVGYCLLRRDADNGHALLGHSQPPYRNWFWQELDQAIGGPVLTLTPDDQLLAVVRLYDPARTSVCQIDPDNASIRELLTLPSAGDTSYAGVIWQSPTQLLISYYSSHEGSSAIYVAEVAVENG